LKDLLDLLDLGFDYDCLSIRSNGESLVVDLFKLSFILTVGDKLLSFDRNYDLSNCKLGFFFGLVLLE
jgi:hypothetical protein